MPCHGPTSGFTPIAISQNGQNRKVFGLQSVEESGWAIKFYQNIATANTENGNCPADRVGLLGPIAACLV
jgi:hypothetical protein